ncbi:TMV resistance protein N-like [Carica papaya]|uniref:TMV resistance protein N-like n=1 Tax=Carica papaya TaxID=3649 RepID=UPI000B8CFA21|nr:TMV resistance protein N-like [Carica papaya]
MQRFLQLSANSLKRRSCDVFINHRCVDTRRTISGLLYDHLHRLGLNPFLDTKTMKPGDKLFNEIDSAIINCKLGISVFSPNYCDSYFCLHELALLMESKKKVIPIFCDVKPSELSVRDDGTCSADDLRRFTWALEQAKYTVGVTFDTSQGDWANFLATTTDAVTRNFLELHGMKAERNKIFLIRKLDHFLHSSRK